MDPIMRTGLTFAFVNLVVTATMSVLLSGFLFALTTSSGTVIPKATFWDLFGVGTLSALGAVFTRHLAKRPERGGAS